MSTTIDRPATTARSAQRHLPAHMRTPGFILFALLPVPALLLLTITSWQAFGALPGLLIAWICSAAVVFFVLAPLPMEEAWIGEEAMPPPTRHER